MHKKLLITLIALTLPAMAMAATTKSGQGDIIWSAQTGLGYDSNAFQAPRAPYIDYAALPLGSNPTVVPQKKSGFFIPYEFKVDSAKNRDQDSRLLWSATADGSYYLGSSVSNANEYNLRLRGGSEYVLAREGKSENTLYVGALVGKHRQVYVDHDTGASKTTTVSQTDISGRYNYIGFGVEAKYKHKIGSIAYGFSGQYVLNDYEDPVVVSQQDHSFFRVGTDAIVPVRDQSRLELSYDHSARDYSNRHARDTGGAALNANPLLSYTYNSFGATLRNEIAPEWLLYLDFDYNTRADTYVGYDDYKENRYGARLLYAQGPLKTRLAFHHWGRDYPHAFAFDVPTQVAKTYSGNDLKFKAELQQENNSAYWAELVYKAQSTTDLRYDYVRTQIMAGMSWAY